MDCVLEKLGSISGVVVFNCVYRAIELDEKNLGDEYAKLFADYSTIGFNCYGEQFVGHIYQTAIMIVFRNPKIGSSVYVKSKKFPFFRAGRKLKRGVAM